MVTTAVTVIPSTAAAVTVAIPAFAAAVAAVATAFTAAVAAAVATVTYEVTASVFQHVAVGATGGGDRPAVTALEFVPGRARGRRSGHAFATDQFVVVRTTRRRNHTAVSAVEFIAGRAVRTVLMEARTASVIPSATTAAAVQRQRPAGADGEKCDCEKRRQA